MEGIIQRLDKLEKLHDVLTEEYEQDLEYAKIWSHLADECSNMADKLRADIMRRELANYPFELVPHPDCIDFWTCTHTNGSPFRLRVELILCDADTFDIEIGDRCVRLFTYMGCQSEKVSEEAKKLAAEVYPGGVEALEKFAWEFLRVAKKYFR